MYVKKQKIKMRNVHLSTTWWEISSWLTWTLRNALPVLIWVKIFLEYYDVQLWCQIEKNTQDYNYFTILFTVTIQKFALQMWLVTKLNLFLEQLQNLLWITVIQIALEFQNLWIILEKIQILKKNNEEERQIVSLNYLSLCS